MLTFIACHAQILMQRRQFTPKTINISAYKIILTHVYKHLSALIRTFAPT